MEKSYKHEYRDYLNSHLIVFLSRICYSITTLFLDMESVYNNKSSLEIEFIL